MLNLVLTYLLTPLTVLQLVKKFPAFQGNRRFITALTSVRHLSLSWASPIQSLYPHPTSWRSTLILSTHLRLGLSHWSLSLRFPQQDPIHPPLPHPYAPHDQPISFFSILSPAQLNLVLNKVSRFVRCLGPNLSCLSGPTKS